MINLGLAKSFPIPAWSPQRSPGPLFHVGTHCGHSQGAGNRLWKTHTHRHAATGLWAQVFFHIQLLGAQRSSAVLNSLDFNPWRDTETSSLKHLMCNFLLFREKILWSVVFLHTWQGCAWPYVTKLVDHSWRCWKGNSLRVGEEQEACTNAWSHSDRGKERGQPADVSCFQRKAYSHPSPRKRNYTLKEANWHGVDDDTWLNVTVKHLMYQ